MRKQVFASSAKSQKLNKAKIFDCILAVTAKENSIEAICTENTADFEGYTFVKALNPFE
jgi:predicted nucleic acid-binding protein